jgi:hypothetical protein
MQKAIIFLIVAIIFGALGFGFAKYCPLASKAAATPNTTPTANSNSAANNSVISQLATLRSQIALYRLQHNDNYPDFKKYGWKQLTFKTNAAGQITESARTPGNIPFGPYFQILPENPLTKSSEILVVSTIEAGFQAPGAFGFVFEECEGRIFALNADGKLFDESAASASADAR